MQNKIWRYFFGKPDAASYSMRMLEESKLKLLQAEDAVDYALSEVEYRRKCVERHTKYAQNAAKTDVGVKPNITPLPPLGG